MDELLEQFLIEARELVQQATDDLLELERNPADRQRLDGAFRAVHTLKGSVGLFDLAPMGAALHAGEDLLGAVRDERAAADRPTISILLELISQTDRWIGALEADGELPPDAAEDGEWLAGAIRSRLPSDAASAPSAEHPQGDTSWIDALRVSAKARDMAGERLLAIRYVPAPDCFFSGDDPLALLRSVPGLVALDVLPRTPWPAADDIDPFACNLVIQALVRGERAALQSVFRFVSDQVSIADIEPVDGPERADAATPTVAIAGQPKSAGAMSLRVEARRIDRLVDLTGELVAAKNALSFVASQAVQGAVTRDIVSGLQSSQATIDRLVAELHAAVMGARMLPLRDALRGLPLAVRDLSVRLGKDVAFTIHEDGVEADKAVVDGLFEPLLHVVRNAVDHGLEPEAERLAAGKPARGQLDLRVQRTGDRLTIAIADDGRGIDPQTIRRVARERGVRSAEMLSALADSEVVDLIFAPGFSTAGAVTDISGRGVGMDAVRAAVERLGGSVGVESVPGRGTTIRLSLPVTVVLSKIMVVRVGDESFGIPMDTVVETARLPRDRIVPIGQGEAFVFRGRTLPLLHLSALLKSAASGRADKDCRVLVVDTGLDLAGIAVDAFGERMDVLLKPMSGLLAGVPGYAGTALRGDGSVLMVLDLPELVG